MKRLACIDLGTNTFHLLIVDADDNGFAEIFRQREYIILAEDGIDTIGDKPLARAHSAIEGFKATIQDFAPDKLMVIGTEALRRASNGHIVTHHIKQALGVEAEIIAGSREAELILKGTQLMVDMNSGQHCIMDIGGGSVEFIIVKKGTISFMHSFPVGVTVLYNRFHKSEPISDVEKRDIQDYLDTKLLPLKKHLDKTSGELSLIGASGSYEVLQSILEGEVKRHDVSTFTLHDFYELCDSLVSKTKEERQHIEGLPLQRVNMIVVAFLLVKFVLDTDKFKEIIVSPYALKEGILSEMLIE